MTTEFSAATFEQSLYTCWEKLRAHARRLTGSWQEAEDLVQEALTKAYSAWPSFRGEASFSTWMHRILNNVHKDLVRKNARLHTIPLDSGETEVRQAEYRQPREDIGRRLELQDLRQAIASGLAGLPQHYRRLLVLKYVKHFSYEELAQAFECSIESIRCRLYRARQELRRELANSV